MRWISPEAKQTFALMQQNMETDIRRILRLDEDTASAITHRYRPELVREAEEVKAAHLDAMAKFAARFTLPEPVLLESWSA